MRRNCTISSRIARIGSGGEPIHRDPPSPGNVRGVVRPTGVRHPKVVTVPAKRNAGRRSSPTLEARSESAMRAIRRGRCGSRPVSRVLSKAAIHLRRTSPYACSDLPGSGAGRTSSPRDMLPYLVLLRVGFTLPPVLPPARCALTAPFHPCLVSLRTCSALTRGLEAVCFLWHFPWARAPQALPGTLPCGARTFLRFASKQRLPGRLPPGTV